MLRRSALRLGRNDASRLLPWLIALEVYFATLALAGLIALQGAIERWQGGGYSVITVELPADADDDAEQAALAVLRATPGVASARALNADEIAALLEPWLGSGAVTADLPLPRLIDVSAASGAAVDWAEAQSRLDQAAAGAFIDTGAIWTERLAALARAAQLFAAAVLVAALLIAATTVVFTVRPALVIHGGVVSLLHLLGAGDGYIAGQFQRHALGLGLKGGVIGVLPALATLVLAGRATRLLEAPLLPALALDRFGWLALCALPVAMALLAMATARVTVLKALARMP